MFKFKRKNDLFKELNRRLTQLECDHSKTHFVEHTNGYILRVHYAEVCSICGKYLTYISEEEKLKKERNQLLSKIRDINSELRVIEKRKIR